MQPSPSAHTIRIDRDVEPPRRSRPEPLVYPWAEMKLDDAFWVDQGGYKSLHERRRGLLTLARAYCRRNKLAWRWETSVMEQGAPGTEMGVRIWRRAPR